MNTPRKEFRIIFTSRKVTEFPKYMDFECDERFKNQLRDIFKYLRFDPFPDNKKKIQTEDENVISYIFEYKGRGMRILYEIYESINEIEIMYIGKRPNVTGYYNMQIEED